MRHGSMSLSNAINREYGRRERACLISRRDSGGDFTVFHFSGLPGFFTRPCMPRTRDLSAWLVGAYFKSGFYLDLLAGILFTLPFSHTTIDLPAFLCSRRAFFTPPDAFIDIFHQLLILHHSHRDSSRIFNQLSLL